MTDPTTPPSGDHAAPLRLTKMRPDAAKLIADQITIGQAIRSQRIVYVQDLDEARGEKQEWVQRTTDLLCRLFTNGLVADQCNDWIGSILPEYAEFEMFIEQFGKEMKHRIGRLQLLLKRLDRIPEPSATDTPEPRMIASNSPSPPPAAVLAPKIQASGLLIARTSDEESRAGILEFMAKLDFSLEILERPATAERKPLIETLAGHDLVEFVVVLSDTLVSENDDLFDLGCCVGRFGTSRVCVLHRQAEQSEKPRDTRGVRHFLIDGTYGWQLLLAMHLKAGGLQVDLNRLV